MNITDSDNMMNRTNRPRDLGAFLANDCGYSLRVKDHKSLISASQRQSLIYIMDHPGCTLEDVLTGLDKTSVAVDVHNYVAIGYVEKTHRFTTNSKLSITSKGLAALEMESLERANAVVIESKKADPYVPPRSAFTRPGALDAFKLPSGGMKA